MIAPPTLASQAECQCGDGCRTDPDSGLSEARSLARDLVEERDHAFHHRMDLVRDLFSRIVLRGEPMETLRAAAAELIGREVTIDLEADGPSGGQRAFPIEASERVLGYVRVAASRGSLDAEQDEIARQAAIWAAMLVLAAGSASRTAAGTTRDADGTRGLPDDWTAQWLARIAFDQGRHYLVIAMMVTSDEPGDDAGATLAIATTAVNRTLQGRRVAAFVGSDGDELVLVSPVSDGARAQVLARTVVEHVASLIRLAGPRYHVTTGLTSLAEDGRAVARRVAEARMAARFGSVLHGPDTVTSFRDLRAFPAIVDGVAGPEDRGFRELHERYLGVLVRYEARTGLPLVQTLTVLFDENGNVSGAARTLGINRQSLLYRLRKIETMCEADLADPADRFALELAVRSWAVRQALFPTAAELGSPTRSPASSAARADLRPPQALGPRLGTRVRAAAG